MESEKGDCRCSDMNLVVFTHKLFRRTLQGYQTDGALTIQMDALAKYFDSVTLCVPVVEDRTFEGISPLAVNISFHPLPYAAGRKRLLQLAPVLRREILTMTSEVDLGLVILPGYYSSLASWVCQRRGFPIFQWMVSDWSEYILARRQGLSHRLAEMAKPVIDAVMRSLTRKVLTFHNGLILYQPAPEHHFIRVSSSLRLADLRQETIDPSVHDPLRVLYVGRLAAEKGVSVLLESIGQLTSQGTAVVLDIVGSGELADQLQKQAVALGIRREVRFHGYVPQGQGLNELYTRSDVLVLPSLQDKNPKVIMEAMAHAVPVIASSVGGIPTIVKDGINGLLVQPAQSFAVTKAVNRLRIDMSLRQRLIENGLSNAREHTVEIETERMMRIVARHFDSADFFSGT